jgi:hypothetical protein
VKVISVPLTIVKLSVEPPKVNSVEVVKLAPVTVTVPPLSGSAAGDTALIIGKKGKVITGLSCQFTESDVVPANAITTEKL